MILAILAGFVTGWLMSMPIGPVNAAAISRTLKYGFKFGIAVGAGASLMDLIYCGGAAQINQFLITSPVINLGFELIGFAALLFLGIRQLSQQSRNEMKDAAEQNKNEVGSTAERMQAAAMKRMHAQEKSLFGPFSIGVLLYATNVMAVPEWIIVSGLWRSWGILESGFSYNAFFAIGAGLGTLGWFSVLIRWISKHHRGFQARTLQKINIGTGIAMLAFSGYFAYAILFQTHWDQVKSHVKENTGQLIDSIKAK